MHALFYTTTYLVVFESFVVLASFFRALTSAFVSTMLSSLAWILAWRLDICWSNVLGGARCKHTTHVHREREVERVWAHQYSTYLMVTQHSYSTVSSVVGEELGCHCVILYKQHKLIIIRVSSSFSFQLAFSELIELLLEGLGGIVCSEDFGRQLLHQLRQVLVQ